MTSNDPFIAQLEEYLDEYEGHTPLPESVRDAVRAELPSTRQRPAWWPARRYPLMNNTVKILLGTAAVVVAALMGYNYLVAPNIGGHGSRRRHTGTHPYAADAQRRSPRTRDVPADHRG
jgi:hypothetical protein